MSTTTSSLPKKPPSTTSTSSERRPPSANSNINRSPSRMAAQTAQTSGTPTTVNRTRSARSGVNGTPVSARAAARKPTGSVSDATLEDGEDAKLELQTKLAELQERLQQSELAYEESKKHIDVLQIKLDESLKEQGMMEENFQGQVEKIEELESERKESSRARRELEQIYESERAQSMREKEESEVEKEVMAANMQRLKETLAQRELRDRVVSDDERRHSMSRTSSLRSEDRSPNPDSRGERGGFAPQSSLQRSDSRSSSRLVLQKDKVIESLRLELAEAQIKLVELENKGGSSMQQFERQMYDIKMQNARLMEENESFQLLLSEKTLNGDLAQSDLLRPPSHDASRPSSRPPRNRTSLADELEDQDESIETDPGGEGSMERRLQAEVNGLKDQNKALTLYINNIISRLLQHEQFEAILDKTPDLMAGPNAASRKYAGREKAVDDVDVGDKAAVSPPPAAAAAAAEKQQPPAQEPQTGGLLQRASSVLRRKPRPVSQLPPATNAEQPRIEEPTVHENPDTAPSIPLSQTSSRSTAASTHRRSRSDWGAAAASVVGNMYKGPPTNGGLGTPGALSPGLGTPGAISPGLASAPPNRTSFFPTPQQMLEAEERERNKENLAANQQPRDSKVPVSSLGGASSPERLPTLSSRNSNRNSIISIPSNPSNLTNYPPSETDPNDLLNSNSNSNPSSPPRSITSSSGEYRDPRGPSGAIMMGSKPRPLRLVQEADEERERKKGNRASWWGGTFGGLLSQGGKEGTGQQQQQ